jgi:FAD/FMN-containing dehydrogenase
MIEEGMRARPLGPLGTLEELVRALDECLGADSVLRGEEARDRMPPGSLARVLLLPRTTAQVSQVLALCHAARTPVVTQGGLTGLVRGAVSGAHELALSLDRMRQIEEVDTLHRTLTAQAGVPLEAAQLAAEQAGLMLPLDLGARGTATLGGNVSTNAGGNRVLRFGMMRDLVLGLEVVLADGTVIDARSKLLKNNTGYDLKQLFIGSEGTLGIVTRVVLRLRPQPRSQNTALVALERFDQVTSFLSAMESRLFGSMSSFEVMWSPFYELVTRPPALGQPILHQGYPYYVLVETLGTAPEADYETLVEALAEAQEAGLLLDAVVASTGAQRRAMWALRDDVDQMRRDGPTFSYDVSLALDEMEAYVAKVQRELALQFPEQHGPEQHGPERQFPEQHGPAFLCYVFGHLADGNLHLVVRVNDPSAHEVVNGIVYGALSADNSSVSAEHGIGLTKKGQLPLSRSQAELGLMRTLKHALDPLGILNPGKIFD